MSEQENIKILSVLYSVQDELSVYRVLQHVAFGLRDKGIATKLQCDNIKYASHTAVSTIERIGKSDMVLFFADETTLQSEYSQAELDCILAAAMQEKLCIIRMQDVDMLSFSPRCANLHQLISLKAAMKKRSRKASCTNCSTTCKSW